MYREQTVCYSSRDVSFTDERFKFIRLIESLLDLVFRMTLRFGTRVEDFYLSNIKSSPPVQSRTVPENKRRSDGS